MDDFSARAADTFQLAGDARREGRFADAIALYQSALAEPDGALSAKQRRKGLCFSP